MITVFDRLFLAESESGDESRELALDLEKWGQKSQKTCF